MIYIRADANENIGAGHIMRCLSIAAALHKKGAEVTFIGRDPQTAELLKKQEFPVIMLSEAADPLRPETELPELGRLLQKADGRNVITETTGSAEVLLVDSYQVTPAYLRELNSILPVVYIDDQMSFAYPVERLINYSFFADARAYQKQYQSAGVKLPELILGPAFTPLRDEFRDVRRMIRSKVSSVLISTGASDSMNVLELLLDRLLSGKTCFNQSNRTEGTPVEETVFYAVVGRLNPNKEHLFEKYRNHPGVRLLYDVSNLSDYMKSCDLSIAAAGVTAKELIACGCPGILYSLADNQILPARKLDELGLMEYAGDIRRDREEVLQRIEDFLKNMSGAAGESIRREQTALMLGALDGRGSERIADRLLVR